MRVSARIVLFVISYMPLLLCVIIQQLAANKGYLHYGSLTAESIYTFIVKFGLSVLLLSAMLFALIGYYCLKSNIKTKFDDGNNVEIIKVKDNDSVMVSYLASMLFPLLTQKYESLSDALCMLVIIISVCLIYINSSLIRINPILSIRYSFYDVTYKEKGKTYNCILMIPKGELRVGEKIKILKLSREFYYGREHEQ